MTSTVRRPTADAGRTLALALGLATALPSAALAAELARGRPIGWTRPPNYSRCTDPADSLQLTDGRRVAAEHIWLDRRTVGWETATGDVIGLRLDLGRPCRLDSLVLSTAAFAPAQVAIPSIVGAIGATPARYAWAGARQGSPFTAAESLRARRVEVHVALTGSGRYLLIAALQSGPFFFADELAIFGEELPAPTAAPATVTPPSPFGRPFVISELAAVAAAQRRAWAVRAALPDPAPAARGVTLFTVAEEESLRLAARASRWRATGAGELRTRRVDPWRPTTPWSDLQPAVTDTLEMWPDAWSAAAVEFAWAGTGPLRVPVTLRPAATAGPRGTLRVVVPVESRDGTWSGDALPLHAGVLVLRPGEVRQLWIDVHATGAASGLHALRLVAGSDTLRVPVRVHGSHPGALPLHALNWTYPEKFALTRGAPSEAIADNAAHGIDTAWIPAEALPWPAASAIDAAGRLTGALDFTACDQELALHRGRVERCTGFFWNFDVRRPDPSGGRFHHPYASPAWRRAVREWLDAWLAHLDSLGYERSRILMQPFDETTSPAASRLFRILHELRPDLPIALTVTRLATPAELQRLLPQLTVAILERRTLPARAEWSAALRQRGAQVWTYDVPEPSKSAPPVASYRHLAWEAWARGLAGCGFWAYGDTGETSADAWDDFDGARADYSVVYGDAGSPLPVVERFVPSKRWQAFRIGMQEAALFEAVRALDPGWPRAILEALSTGAAERDPESLRRQALVRMQ